MKTPAGKECQYFYGDYYRGRNHEECRLLADQTPPLPWKPELCRDCPVPDIQLANACTDMILEPRLIRPFPFIRRQVAVDTRCLKTQRHGFPPHIGCGQCHPLPDVFIGADRDPDPPA
jgi:hypothetical protein